MSDEYVSIKDVKLVEVELGNSVLERLANGEHVWIDQVSGDSEDVIVVHLYNIDGPEQEKPISVGVGCPCGKCDTGRKEDDRTSVARYE